MTFTVNILILGLNLVLDQQKFIKSSWRKSSVSRWVKDFKSGSVLFTDKDKSGRPRSSRSENNVQEMAELISENPHYTVCELSRLSGLSYGSVYSILTEDRGKRIVCSK